MNEMVKIPSGKFLSIDAIESIEDDGYGDVGIYMKSGRVHLVSATNAIHVRYCISAQKWPVAEI